MNPHSNLVSGAGQDLYRVGADSWLNRDTVADRYLPPGLRGAALADITRLRRDLLSRHPVGDANGMRLVAVRA
jgi:hypothetical protein